VSKQPEKTRCCQPMYDGFYRSTCLHAGKLEHNGKLFCAIHYPPNVEAKRKKADEKRAIERAARDRKWAISRAREKIVDHIFEHGWNDTAAKMLDELKAMCAPSR
jgi:uncharacterized Zn finger protein (UPF0148 family)